MKGMSPFQLVVTGVFAAFIIIGVAFFALFRGDGNSGPISNLTVWGFMTEPTFNSILESAGVSEDPSLNVTKYTQVDPTTFDRDFVEALARGESPDVVMIPHTSLIRQRDKIFPIPYESYSQRNFQNTFIEGGELFLSEEGILAVPFILDPLVMYWNRTMFSNAGIATPPQFWDEFFNLTQQMVKKDPAFNITQSAIAFGGYQNVTNAKEILSALIMQAGSPITSRSEDKIKSSLLERFNQPIIPAEAAVNFYTEFSNPVNNFYSWNRSLPNSQDYFISGDLATYFGLASEVGLINTKNPNLNFDAAVLPQSRGGAEVITFANMAGLSIPKASRDVAGAFRLISTLTSQSSLNGASQITGLPPVRRDLLSEKPSDPFFAIFYDSALWSRAWFDPGDSQTEEIFQIMIEDVTSGRESISGALSRASSRLQALLSNVSF